MRLFFARLDEKHNLLESFEKIFEIFPKKIAKNALFLHIFQKKLTNHSLIFCPFGRKTQIVGKFWENFENFRCKFYWKIEFLFFILFFENVLLKIEPSEITPVFYNNFFGFGGGGISPFPLATHFRKITINAKQFLTNYLDFPFLLFPSYILACPVIRNRVFHFLTWHFRIVDLDFH